MDKSTFKKICEQYCAGQDFILNPDPAFLDLVLEGVMAKQKETGFRFCPCRLGTGSFQKDISLLCPCHFQAQEIWKQEGIPCEKRGI